MKPFESFEPSRMRARRLLKDEEARLPELKARVAQWEERVRRGPSCLSVISEINRNALRRAEDNLRDCEKQIEQLRKEAGC